MSFLKKLANTCGWSSSITGIRGTSWAASKLPLQIDYALANLVGDFIYLPGRDIPPTRSAICGACWGPMHPGRR